MQTPTTYLCLALASLAVGGCQQMIDLGEEGSTQLLIESRLQVGAPVEVSMRVINSFGEVTPSSALTETTGRIEGSDGSSGLLYVHTAGTSSAILRLDSVDVAEGVTYTLSLETPGFAALRSLTTVPRGVDIDAPPPTTDGGQESRPDSSFLSARLYFEDIPGEDSYYHVIVKIVDEGDTAASALPVPVDLISAGSGAVVGTAGTWLFDDREFADGAFDARLRVSSSALYAMQRPTAIVEVRTVSRSYFSFAQAELKRDNSRIGQGVGAATRDNVVGGGGLFASYASTTVRRPLY